jgi:hypothetical protein
VLRLKEADQPSVQDKRKNSIKDIYSEKTSEVAESTAVKRVFFNDAPSC